MFIGKTYFVINFKRNEKRPQQSIYDCFIEVVYWGALLGNQSKKTADRISLSTVFFDSGDILKIKMGYQVGLAIHSIKRYDNKNTKTKEWKKNKVVSKNKKYTCMKELEIFNILTDTEKNTIYGLARGSLLKKGELLFRQGEEGDNVFLIQTGKIMLQKFTKDGTKIVIDILKPGDLICENIIFEEINYPFSGIALENSYICACSKKEMVELIKDPVILEKIFFSMNSKMMEYTQRMTNSALKDVQDKVYNTLKQIAGRHGRITNLGLEIDCYLSHEDIGFLVNASRVSVTRSINQLIEMGKLEKNNRHYIVH